MAAVIPQQLLRTELASMRAYRVADAEGFIKLDAMENPYVWPATLQEQWLDVLGKAVLNRYPDPQVTHLRKNFSKAFSIPSSIELIFGNGSDELIQLVILAIARPGACILTVTPSFSMYKLIAEFIGVRVIGVPLLARSFSLQVDQICKAIQENDPALIFLACPNNPTGTLWPQQQVEQIVQQSRGLVVIDEAYAPFSSHTMMPLVEKYPHVLMLRTLSKMGLAGLRLGCLLGAEQWLRELNKLRLPYNINALTQISASFALDNIAVFNEQARLICEQRERLTTAMRSMNGIQAFPSEANFILFRTVKTPAGMVFNRLMERKIMIKNVADNHLLENCLRVTVGTEKENQAFLDALDSSLI